MAFAGSKFLPWIVAGVTFIAAYFAIMLLCSMVGMLDYIDPSKSDSDGNIGLVITSFLLALIGAIVAAIIVRRFFFYGFVFLGFAAGYFAGTLFYTLVFVAWLQSEAALLIISLGFAFTGAFLCYKFKDQLAILTTSALGAYAFVRGISMFVGNYPNEITLYQEIQNGTATFDAYFLGYVAGMVVVFVAGTIVQTKRFKNDAVDHFTKA